MPTPTKPNVSPIWTQGNSGQREQPTDGEQFSGFTPNFRPPAKWHNWLFGIFSDWITWLDYVTTGGVLPVSNAGHNVATGVTLQSQLDELDAALSSLGFVQEVPTGVVNGINTNFELSQAPINNQSVMVSVDGGVSFITSDFTIQQISGNWFVVFGAAPAVGQQPYVVFLTGSSGVGVGGGVAAIENDPGGVGIYDTNVLNVAKLKSLIAGSGMTITDNGNGTITLVSSGGGGGGAIENHGSAGAEILIDPAVGIVPTTANDQVWWVKPNAGAGAVPITANPAIAAGVAVGQRLTLKSVAVVGGNPYLTIPNNAGTDMNGPCAMGTFGQSIEFMYDGTNWSENTRRV